MHRYLPTEIIELVFSQLITTYGTRFQRQYDGSDLAVVKKDWQRELGGFVRSGKDGAPTAPAVLYGLQHLPEQPPNVLQFRNICRLYRANEQLALSGKRAPAPEHVRKLLARLKDRPAGEEPERIRVARNYIAKWGGPGEHLTPFRAQTLAEMRERVERWERHPVQEEEATS